MTTNSPPISLQAAYDECQAITRREARNFYYAFITLPKPRRRSIYAAYAFSRLADDIADGDGVNGVVDIESKSVALSGLRQALHRGLGGAPEGAIMIALANTATTYGIPESLFDNIIDGVEMDLTKSRYATFKDLREYCYRVASTVGLVSIQIFGYDDPQAKVHAVDLGLAMQLTNIIRDVGEDAGNGRIQVFDSEANYITEWGTRGSAEGQFDFGVGVSAEDFTGSIAVDDEGFIYVADVGNQRIQKFAP